MTPHTPPLIGQNSRMETVVPSLLLTVSCWVGGMCETGQASHQNNLIEHSAERFSILYPLQNGVIGIWLEGDCIYFLLDENRKPCTFTTSAGNNSLSAVSIQSYPNKNRVVQQLKTLNFITFFCDYFTVINWLQVFYFL